MQYKKTISGYLKSHVAYEFRSPVYNAGYIGTQIKEHCGLDKNSPIFNHLAEFNLNQYTLTLHSFLGDRDVTLTNQDILEYIRTTVPNNVGIIGKPENWD